MEFSILGPLEVHDAGEQVRIGGTRQRKLLALLLLDLNRVVPLDRLVNEVWDSPPQSVRQQVHNAIGALRRSLCGRSDDVSISWENAGYRLSMPEEWLDSSRFLGCVQEAERGKEAADLHRAAELLQSALAGWRGDALAGLAGLGGSAIENAGAALNEKRLTAVEDLAALRLRLGEAGALVGELVRRVAEHPLRESLRASLMLALYRSGRQADALAVFDEGRRVTVAELGLNPGKQLRDLQSAILNDDVGVDLAPAPPAPQTSMNELQVGTTSPQPDERPAKCFLPHDITSFSGRSTELVTLVEETRNASPAIVISAIDGMGGVGKTTLAIHLAHHVAQDYPDGQYFVNLHGFSHGRAPLTAAQALEILLLDSGVPVELVPATVERRSSLWRSTLAGQRILVILDNAIDTAQVQPLLPGTAGALVVVTSRRRLAVLDGRSLSLDVMTADEGADLFRAVAGAARVDAEPLAVAEVVELCGRLPLAIRMAAARLRSRTTWTVSDLVDRLRNHEQRTSFLQSDGHSVMTVLSLSYRYLAPAQQRLFRLLSLHRGVDFDEYTASALTGMSVNEAEIGLESLFDDNLLKQNVAGRYHFHDLISDCSAQLRNQEDDEARQRDTTHDLLDYYLYAAHTWCAQLDRGIHSETPRIDRKPAHVRPVSSPAEAIEVLNAEFANLSALVRFAAESGWHQHAWQLVAILQPFLRLRNYGGDSYELFHSAVLASRACADPLGESVSLHGLAAVCYERRTTEEATSHLRDALALSRQAGDENREATQLADLGTLMVAEERLHEAWDLFENADKLTLHSSNIALRAAIANNLGVIARDFGRLDQALDHLNRAMRIITADVSMRLRLHIWWSLGTVLHLRREHRAALEEFEQILRQSEKVDFQRSSALALLGLCATQRALGNLEDSVDSGRRSLALARRYDLRKVECEVLNNIGEAYLASKNYERAEQVYRQARERAEEHRMPRYDGRALEGLAHVALAQGDATTARQRWEQAITRYPVGMIDAEYAREHLGALENSTTTCFRCEPVNQG